MDVAQPEILHVPVTGGELTVGRWGTGDRVVVAPHGITANHVSWAYIATELGHEFTVYAPDLRGRGGSAALPGPYGMAAHARDCIAILDHVGADTAVMAGHSMGGFVTVAAAIDHPERLSHAVLVDGGLPLPLPEGVPDEQLIAAIVGPAIQRLSMTFASVDDYYDFWRAHPSFQGDDWTPLAQDYFAYDVHEVDGTWRSKVVPDVIQVDSADPLQRPVTLDDIAAIEVPLTFVWAPRGIMNADPLYPWAVVDEAQRVVPDLEVVRLDDVNHYTLALRPEGARQVAEVIRKAAG